MNLSALTSTSSKCSPAINVAHEEHQEQEEEEVVVAAEEVFFDLLEYLIHAHRHQVLPRMAVKLLLLAEL